MSRYQRRWSRSHILIALYETPPVRIYSGWNISVNKKHIMYHFFSVTRFAHLYIKPGSQVNIYCRRTWTRAKNCRTSIEWEILVLLVCFKKLGRNLYRTFLRTMTWFYLTETVPGIASENFLLENKTISHAVT